MTFLQQLIDARRRRRAVQQLRALPPELLRDIGIEPHRDLDQAVSEMLAGRAETRPMPRPSGSLGAQQVANC